MKAIYRVTFETSDEDSDGVPDQGDFEQTVEQYLINEYGEDVSYSVEDVTPDEERSDG